MFEGEFADRVIEAFDAHKHKTIATLRKDGSPRISGTEARFRDGYIWFGSMRPAVKASDLIRDGRFAMHSATVETSPETMVDAKITGVAVEITDADEKAWYGVGDGYLFRGEIRDAALTWVEDKKYLVVESWNAERGYRRTSRE